MGLYLGGATLFNHSCKPNCEVAHGLPALTVTTLEPVEKGAPLTISYMEGAGGMSVHVRRARLLHQYGFHCTCPLCEAEEIRTRKRTPPRFFARCHRRGDHYVIAVGMYAAGVPPPVCFLFLGLYFILWVKILRFPI